LYLHKPWTYKTSHFKKCYGIMLLSREWKHGLCNISNATKQKKTLNKHQIYYIIKPYLTSAYSKGRSFYRLSNTSPIKHVGLVCSSWIATDVSNTANPVVTSQVTKCPPTLLQTTDSLVQFTDDGIPTDKMTCYADRSATSSTSRDPRTKRCCYDNSNKGLILDHTLANGFNTYRYSVLCNI
jgi:hypothetical protein